MSKLQLHDLRDAGELGSTELTEIHGGRFRKSLAVPDYKEPTVYSDDGINIQTSDPSKSNVGFDSPFTPIG